MELIVLDHEPYSFSREKMFFVEEFIQANVKVHYLCLHKTLSYSKQVKYKNEIKRDFVENITSFKNLFRILDKKNIRDTVILTELRFDQSTLKIYKYLKRRNFIEIKINYYFNTVKAFSVNHRRSYGQRLSRLKIKNVYDSGLRFITRKLYHKLNEVQILFITGSDNTHTTIPYNKLISIDYFDVLEYKAISDSGSIIEGDYILFLDTMIVNHPDQYIHYDTPGNLDADIYFSKMKTFFNTLEKNTGLPIVIACHPKSSYTNEFGNRKYFYGQTGILSKHCKFVLNHGSLSISFALQALKPIFFIMTNEILNHNNNSFLKEVTLRAEKVCEGLDVPLVNIDSSEKIKWLDAQVNYSKYKSFLKKYFRKSTETLPSNFEIVKTNLESLLSGT